MSHSENNIFNSIVNPETGRRVSIHGTLGKRVLRNYLNHSGGAGNEGKVSEIMSLFNMSFQSGIRQVDDAGKIVINKREYNTDDVSEIIKCMTKKVKSLDDKKIAELSNILEENYPVWNTGNFSNINEKIEEYVAILSGQFEECKNLTIIRKYIKYILLLIEACGQHVWQEEGTHEPNDQMKDMVLDNLKSGDMEIMLNSIPELVEKDPPEQEQITDILVLANELEEYYRFIIEKHYIGNDGKISDEYIHIVKEGVVDSLVHFWNILG